MQFYTKLSHAKIIIFLSGRLYLQYMFRAYFPYAVYFLVPYSGFVFYHYYFRKCFRASYKFCSKCWLRHFPDKPKSGIVTVPALVDNR